MVVQERMSGYKIVDTWIYVRGIYQKLTSRVGYLALGGNPYKRTLSLATCPYSHNPIIATITHVLPYPRD
jgi:hypothetical protein